MAKVKISEFDVNPDNNTDINNINIAEGCAPSGINNAIRQLMSDLKAFQTGADGDPFNGAVNGTVGATTPATGAFTTLSASGAFSANGGATLGDASGDALTINSSAVSIPNGLNFDSNTLVIDATNNRVGVGTASPAEELDVNVSQNGQTRVQVKNTNTGTGAQASVYIANSDTANYYLSAGLLGTAFTSTGLFVQNSAQVFAGSQIDGLYIHTQKIGSPLVFGTEATEKMRITSAGNVGIGTSSPASALSVVKGAAGDEVARFQNSGNFGIRIIPQIGGSGSVTAIRTGSGESISFDTNNTERMRIDNTGNVGIGTSSPVGKLDVVASRTTEYSASTIVEDFLRIRNLNNSGAANQQATLAFSVSSNNGANSGLVLLSAVAPTSGASTADFVVQTRSAGGTAERLRIDSSGNLGLGVTPSAWSGFGGVIELKGAGFVGSATNNMTIGANLFYNGTNTIYKTTAHATYYHQISGQHAWYTAPSGTAGNTVTFTQAMTLDASGRLGIGTSSPEALLTINQNNANGIVIRSADTNGSTVDIGVSTTSGYSYVAASRRGTGTFQPLAFFTSSLERMRINSSGNLLVGRTDEQDLNTTTTKGLQLSQNGLISASRSSGAALALQRTTNDGAVAAFFRDTATVGSISITTTATTYNTSSDYRLKENIAPMTGALAKVQALKPVTYTWKSTGEASQGFIAHELAEVVPDCVTGEKDAVDEEGNPQYQGIDTSFLVATLTAAIQELNAKVTALEAQLNK